MRIIRLTKFSCIATTLKMENTCTFPDTRPVIFIGFVFAQFFLKFHKSGGNRIKLKARGRLCKTLNHFF